MEVNLNTQFDIDENNGTQVVCPICGDIYTHINGVSRDTLISTGNQGNATIEFYGECGHEWLLIFDGYKGEVHQATAIVTKCIKLIEIEE
jgi:hypothetical protein